jgi:hypothetical protein
VTHFIPWEFPLLVIVPALAIDLILQRTGGWRPLVRGLVTGLGFTGIFVAVQWPFANFLMTPLARNWVFGTQYMDYGTRPTSAYARFVFLTREVTAAQFGQRMMWAALTAILMAWIGIRAGRSMRRVRR